MFPTTRTSKAATAARRTTSSARTCRRWLTPSSSRSCLGANDMNPVAWRSLCAMAASGILGSCASMPDVEKMNDSPKQTPRPPVAAAKPHDVKAPFGAVRMDPYYWLRDDSREDPQVIGYLEAENAY